MRGVSGSDDGGRGFVFARPIRSASAQLAGGPAGHEVQVFHDLPTATGEPPFRLELATVLGQAAVDVIATAGEIVFHTVGDTGGIDNQVPQQIVAMWMERDAGAHSSAFF